MRTRRKLAVTLPLELADKAEQAVASGRSASVSAYITEAVAARAADDELVELLDRLDAELGPPDAEAKGWARRVLGLQD